MKDPSFAARFTTAETKLQQAQSILEIDLLAKANESRPSNFASDPAPTGQINSGTSLIEQELAAMVSVNVYPYAYILP